MNRSGLAFLATVMVDFTGTVAAGQEPRDPDRGLDAALRERLALVDPAKDESLVERHAAAIEARLQALSALWSERRLGRGLADASWIDPALRVAPLFAPPEEAASGNPMWRTERAARSPGTPTPAVELARALEAWRDRFPGESRLDFEVLSIDEARSPIPSQVRLCASGPSATARLQHNAVWTCTWRIDGQSAVLTGLHRDSFEAITLAGHPAGLYTDVTASLFEDPELFRQQIAPGLDHWRRNLAATLFPGALGHHGIAIGDVDGDGREDLYLCRPGGLPNQLLLHRPDHRVAAATDSGVDLLDYSSSALLVDLDQDRDLDLVVSTGTGLGFFANDGVGHFEQRLLIERSLATSLAAADYDADGDVDLFVCSYLSPYEENGLPVPYHDANNGEANMLLRNDGEWRFADVTVAAGMGENNQRFSLAAAWEDFDNDGDQDLYVANDFGRNNLYRNEGGRFRDVAESLAALDVAAGMGVTWADVDLDGWMDLYVTNLHSSAGLRLTSRAGFPAGFTESSRQYLRHHAQGNTLLLNREGRGFGDVARASGTSLGRWGWGAIFVDFDNDGALDLFAPNGFVTGTRREDADSFFWRQVVLQSPEGAGAPGESYSLGWRAVNRLMRQGYSWSGNQRNVAFRNLGGGRFADVSSAIGLDHADDSRAAARIDWDGDGDEDLLVTHRTAPMLRLLRNELPAVPWTAFELRARSERATAVGARIVLEASDGRRHLRTLRCGEGYLAQSSSRVHFGLAGASVAKLSVRWPDGVSEDFGKPAPGSAHLLVQGAGEARALPAPSAAPHLRPSASGGWVPAAASRTVLPTPLPLPRLSLETWDGRPASVLGITAEGPRGTGQAMLLVLWSVADASSPRLLEQLGGAAEVLRGAGLQQIVALCIDAGAAPRERALALWKDVDWPFARGFASEEAIGVLEIVQAALQDDAGGLATPVCFLIDPKGNLVATYQGGLEPERLRQDLGLIPLSPDERRAAAVPFRGRWISPLPQPLDPDVAARLSAHGLDRPASEYELARVEVRKFSAASVEYTLGNARQRQGRLVEATGHFKRALAAESDHVEAARGLARALHELGEHAAALEAYRLAIRLEPGHAPTRCQLGYLYLALQDFAGARGELRALRELKSELADGLEAELRSVTPIDEQ